MSKKYRPPLGTKIVARAKIVKMQRKEDSGAVTTLWPVVDECVEGIFVGFRLLAQGVTDYVQRTEDDVAWVFMPKLHLEAWLIAVDPRRRPVFVLPEYVTELDEMNLGRTHFFLRGEIGSSDYAAISIASTGKEDWPRWMKEHAAYLLKDDWREVGWQEWFLAKDGEK